MVVEAIQAFRPSETVTFNAMATGKREGRYGAAGP